MRLRDIYKKGTIAKCILLSSVAFFVGIAGYIGYCALVDEGQQNKVSAAWQQISVSALEACDCVVKLAPTYPQGGDGSEPNPFVVDNKQVEMIVGVNGAASFEVIDQNGNVLFSHTKTGDNYVEVPFEIELRNGVGIYEISIIMLDGTTTVGAVWLNYRAIGPPTPPNTGYLYVGGYAFNGDGALMSGFGAFMVSFVVTLLLVFVHYLRRREQERVARETRPKVRIPKDIYKK